LAGARTTEPSYAVFFRIRLARYPGLRSAFPAGGYA
jgi:hypothetical protein